MSEPLHNPRYSPNITSSEIKLPERPMQIILGKRYKTRNGNTFVVVFDKRMLSFPAGNQPWIAIDVNDPSRVFDFTESGGYRFDSQQSDHDLIAEHREPRKLEATVHWYDMDGIIVHQLYPCNRASAKLLAIEKVTTTEGKGA